MGDEAVVEQLLKAGADANVRSCDGVTPLHDAVFSGHYQVMDKLLRCRKLFFVTLSTCP